MTTVTDRATVTVTTAAAWVSSEAATNGSNKGPPRHLDHIGYFSLSINLITIVAGNIALLVFVSSRPKSRMTYFITNLGVSDLFVGLFCVLPQFIDRVLMQFYGPAILCKLKFFTQTLVSYGAAYALVALSIDRVDAIANPLRASTSRRKRQTASLIAGSWILSAVYSSPELIWSTVNEHSIYGRQCSIMYGSGANTTSLEKRNFWKIFVTANLVTIIIIPVTIVAVCHVVLIVVIFRSGRGPKLPAGSGSHARSRATCGGGGARPAVSNRNTITRAKVKTVKVTCTIVSVFILCWLPYTVGNFLDIYHVTPVSTYVKVFIQTLGTLNSAANPIIFFIFNHNQCCNRARTNGSRPPLQQQQQQHLMLQQQQQQRERQLNYRNSQRPQQQRRRPDSDDEDDEADQEPCLDLRVGDAAAAAGKSVAISASSRLTGLEAN